MGTISLLDTLKARHGLASDYAAAKLLGITTAQVSRYRTGRDHFGDEISLRVAALLGEDPGAVLAQVHADRAKDPAARAAWLGLLARLRSGTVAAGVASLCFFGGGPDGGAIAALPSCTSVPAASVSYVKWLLRLLARLIPRNGVARLAAA